MCVCVLCADFVCLFFNLFLFVRNAFCFCIVISSEYNIKPVPTSHCRNSAHALEYDLRFNLPCASNPDREWNSRCVVDHYAKLHNSWDPFMSLSSFKRPSVLNIWVQRAPVSTAEGLWMQCDAPYSWAQFSSVRRAYATHCC